MFPQRYNVACMLVLPGRLYEKQWQMERANNNSLLQNKHCQNGKNLQGDFNSANKYAVTVFSTTESSAVFIGPSKLLHIHDDASKKLCPCYL